MRRIALCLFITLLILAPAQPAFAQDDQPAGPVYIIQSGDTFYSIAVDFGVTVDEIVQANPDLDPNFLTIGMEVVIPGLEGVRGRLTTQTVPLGETLRTLSIRNRITESQIIRLNRLTSPAQVYAGSSLIIPQQDDVEQPQNRYLIGQNQSLFEIAAANNANPWLLAEINHMEHTWDILPGEAVFDQAVETESQLSLISPVIHELVVDPLPLEQGEATSIKITTTQPVELSGSLAGRPLRFFPTGENSYVALQGIHAMSEPGLVPITIQGALDDGSTFSFEQMIVLEALGYIQEKIDGVDPATMDPANTKPEEDQILAVVSGASPEKLWDGPFVSPGYDPNWITSTFGNRRSYNGGPFNYFHTGVDYGGGTRLPIKAPAPGIVVFAGPLTVRGNATILDHGWGIYSGFWHQSEIHVKVGDRVNTGDVIGLIGGTGRITRPHLHWRGWVNGVQVQPLTWLEREFP